MHMYARILPRATVLAVQGGGISAGHSRTLATAGSRLATDHMESPRLKTKFGVTENPLHLRWA